LISSDPKTNQIEVVEINDNLIYFYWGRHPEHDILDMRLGGGSYAIHKGDSAIVVDTMNSPAQGEWVKNYLQARHLISKFTVVISHWHLDHIAGNWLYRDVNIVGHTDTQKNILAHKDAIEAGTLWRCPGFPAVPPNIIFENRADLWLDDLKVELHEFAIHEPGHIAVILPRDKIMLAGDMLEDPIWIFNLEFAAPEIQLAEFRRMMEMDIDKIYPAHGNLEVVKTGGYEKKLINNNVQYLCRMIVDMDSPDFHLKTAQEYIDDALTSGELNWWEPYSEIHLENIAIIKKFAR
jgi:glyoxylase-like metal-dependent hydrolase (beta-lactamase superfamily II)